MTQATEPKKKYTLMDHLIHVEGHDDLYRGHREHFLCAVLNRVVSQAFYPFLNRWPTATVKPNYQEDNFKYNVKVKYEHWTQEKELDATLYWTDKAKFVEQLEAFAKELSDWFIAKQNSGSPWFSDDTKGGSYFVAHLKIRDKQYTSIHVHLAKIKHRGGKWCWYLIPDEYKRSDWAVTEHKQGHANSLDEAKAKVLEHWKGPLP